MWSLKVDSLSKDRALAYRISFSTQQYSRYGRLIDWARTPLKPAYSHYMEDDEVLLCSFFLADVRLTDTVLGRKHLITRECIEFVWPSLHKSRSGERTK